MQIFYTNVKTRGINGVSPAERHEMHNAKVDYGALHHTPTHEQISRSASTTPAVANLLSPAPSIQQQLPSRPSTEALKASNQREDSPSSKAQYDFTEIDIFDTDYTISSAEMETLLLTSTQDFWGLLPGEVEMY